jgi:P-type conjugative transfer protein TrbG
MKRLYLTGVLWAALARAALAQQAPSPAASPAPAPVFVEPTALYLGGQNPTLNPQEKAGVEITKTWEDKSLGAMVQQPGPDGACQFRYGESFPQIVCAALNVTDIELQPGEVVRDVAPGDSERWLVTPTLSGESTKTEHLIVKPKDFGLKTSLVVTTDRRTYHLELVSHEKDFMAYVRFLYKDAPAAVTPVSAPAKAPAAKPVAPASGPKVRVAYEEAVPSTKRVLKQSEGKGADSWDAQEDDGYRISGKAPWKPSRVYTEAGKTFIELPSHTQETPALFVLRKGGLLGLGSQKRFFAILCG